jgi:hypothetical protein
MTRKRGRESERKPHTGKNGGTGNAFMSFVLCVRIRVSLRKSYFSILIIFYGYELLKITYRQRQRAFLSKYAFIYIYIYIRVCVCVCMYACKIIIHPNIFDEIGRESKLQWSICLGKQAFKTK